MTPALSGADVAHRTVDSPIGPLLLAASEAGVVKIAFQREGFDNVLAFLAEAQGARVSGAVRPLDRVAMQLDEYFAGSRREFDVPLDHSLSKGFRLRVQQLMPEIEYGTTWSYRKLAERAGNANTTRAVGTACGTNPLPIVIPCHRVLRTDGSLGGYAGGLDIKVALLDLERDGTLASLGS
ncbi:methylated-DNA--[protein]-cysteine S-methyltransferase [Rarobacter faecitabidus]|uniref:Methylated-DNA--protein-cysteine methyltransferase n=1 Tax=Rarobacter faecitabidus TaxID=13243 RepID=A0A542ZUV8_RARFA|nr:methylated-DNA--[protein]-cysteine S-methyltransferase [Rarobacter faecitabidus]TQL64122.1 methylated-DNA-[protein]-cysteine S-methyltransferase [Rarobacter faecitabidus]